MKRSNYKKKSELTKKKTITIHDEFELCPSHIALLLFFKIFFFFYVYDFKTSLHDLSNVDFPTQIIIVFTDSN